MNEGASVDELAARIQLPENLAAKPYLQQLYGCTAWSVRSIYANKVGWFDGDPIHIAPLTLAEESQRMVALAGGVEALLAQAQEALDQGDERWAARLANYVLQLQDTVAGQEQATAREILAKAYEAMGKNILPITGKNYLQSCALGLRL